MIKAVIFDLDNTLYDYDKCNAFAEARLFETIALDFAISKEQAVQLLKQAKKNVKEQLGSGVAASHNRLLYMQNVCEQAGRNPFEYALKFYDVYWNTFLANMTLFTYAGPLLQELRQKNMKVGVLTDLTAHIQYRKIIRLGIENQIDYLVTSEEAGAEKPSEKIFRLMLAKMNVCPEEALMIGDSLPKDIQGAEAVGIRGLLFGGKVDAIAKTRSLLG